MAIEDVAGKTLWIRAKDLTPGTVSSWPDVSPHARPSAYENATSTCTASATPLGGNAVTFSTGGFTFGPGQFRASTVFGSAYEAENAFDGNSSTTWHTGTTSAPQWLQIRLLTAGACTGYSIKVNNSRGPGAFKFQGSNDGSSWDDLDTRSGLSWTATETKNFTFSNSTSYLLYRIYATTLSGDGYLQFEEVTLTGVTVPTALGSVHDGELWMVVKSDGGNVGSWNMGTSGQSSHYPFSGAVYDDTGSTTRRSFTPSLAITSWRIYRVRVESGNWTAYLDGTQQTTASGSTRGWTTTLSVGRSLSQQFAGKIAEVIVFQEALSSGDATVVSDYLIAEHFTASGAFDGTATLSGTGAITAAGVRETATGATLSGTGTLSTAGAVAAASTASLSGTGTLTAAGSVVSGYSTGATLSGTGTLTAAGESGLARGASLTGTGSIAAAGVAAAPVDLEPWTSGASGEALLNLTPDLGVLEVTYPATAAPAAITEVANLAWQSHETATVGGDTEGMVSVPLGVPHVWVDGVDVTYFRDVPCLPPWRSESPFAWTGITLRFPQVFHYEERGVGDLAWMRPDAPVEIAIVRPDGSRIHRFTGQLTSDDPGVGRGRTECVWGVEGIFWQSDHAHHPVPARLDPTDIGTLVPDELNGTPSRRFSPIAHVSTGIPTRQRGSHGQTRWQWTADQLATAITDAGEQWTIEPTGPRSFAMVLKDTTTVHWTVTAGAPGVDLDLSNDHHERIDAVYGRGVGPDGYAWANLFFPDLLPYDPPDYPYSDPDQNVLLGDTDADTLTGTGISDWQRRIRDLGYTSLAVDGVINSADIDAVRWIQRRMGIQVDGYLGPQTWAATWNVGAVGGDLRTIRLPLAVRPEVEQWIYAANGAIVGANPEYDPSIIRHEVDIDFGAGIRKEGHEGGRILAQKILERGIDPGIVGTIKLTTCPWEGSRWEIDAGDNVLLKGYRGDDVLMRVTAVDADPESLTVTLTVDSEFRDAMAVVQILQRNRESKADPARRPGNPSRRSRQDQDQVTPFEGESPAGRFPRMAIFEGLWTVWPVPVSEIGIVAKLRFTTSGPASKFAVSVWGAPITANQIAAKVPDPLAVSNPFNVGDAWLEDHAFIDSWGELDQAAGYGMLGSEFDGDTVTGRLIDDAGFPYVSAIPPWIWVGVYSPTSCYIEGRFYPDPVQ